MSRNKYHTEAKDIIYEKIKQFDGGFTIKDLKEIIDKDNRSIGLTTIYRIVDELVRKEFLKKYYTESNMAYYEYLKKCNSDNHFYLKCVKCGKTKHIDCDCINDFSNHILKEHNFNISNNNLFITGVCNKCKK